MPTPEPVWGWKGNTVFTTSGNRLLEMYVRVLTGDRANSRSNERNATSTDDMNSTILFRIAAARMADSIHDTGPTGPVGLPFQVLPSYIRLTRHELSDLIRFSHHAPWSQAHGHGWLPASLLLGRHFCYISKLVYRSSYSPSTRPATLCLLIKLFYLKDCTSIAKFHHGRYVIIYYWLNKQHRICW